MTVTQAAKAQQFRALHEAPGAFVVANVWDGGSARMMAALGFAALATSSGASAGLLGRRDGRVTRDEALAKANEVLSQGHAISVDLFGEMSKDPEDARRVADEYLTLIDRLTDDRAWLAVDLSHFAISGICRDCASGAR